MSTDVRQQMVELLPRMRRFAYTLSGSMDEADDIVQSACERALGRLDQFTPGTRLDSWMFQIIRTTFLNRLRENKRKRTEQLPDAETIGMDARIHESTVAKMDLAIIRETISKLPEDQATVLGLVTVDGMTYQEAADLLQIPIGTIMSRLARARRRLAAAIENGTEPTQRPASAG